MVKTEFHETWRCPYCSHSFNDDDDCYEHIEQSHTESPIKDNKKVYLCEVCKEEFDKFEEAKECETEHEEGNDIKWQSLLHQREMDKLRDAGEHPNQKKLVIENEL